MRARLDVLLERGGSGRREPIELHVKVVTTATGFELRAQLLAPDGPAGEREIRSYAAQA